MSPLSVILLSSVKKLSHLNQERNMQILMLIKVKHLNDGFVSYKHAAFCFKKLSHLKTVY